MKQQQTVEYYFTEAATEAAAEAVAEAAAEAAAETAAEAEAEAEAACMHHAAAGPHPFITPMLAGIL